MNSEILFSETQRFRQWWLWALILGINVPVIYSLSRTPSLPTSGIILYVAVMLLVISLFLLSKLETQIKSDGIYVRFLPLLPKFRRYSWNTISKSFVRKYSPLKEFGGYGLRWGLSGTAYNVSGDEGLQLNFSDGKKILIGTNKSSEMTQVLSRIGHLNP